MRAVLLSASLLAPCAHAAVAFDAFSNNVAGGANASFTHTPVGTPRAALCIIEATTTAVSAATYGGTAMTKVIERTAASGLFSGETISTWFLGSSVPTGAQTVALTGPANGTVAASCITLTAATDTAIQDSDFIDTNNTPAADPSVSLTASGNTVFAAIGGHTGVNAVTDPTLAPLASWNSRHEFDAGTHGYFTYTYNTIGTSDVTAGYSTNGAADHALVLAVLVKEASASSTHVNPISGKGGTAAQPVVIH